MNKIINIDELEVGQIVAEPVMNKFREVIISQGSYITDSHKLILKTWNINKITVITTNGTNGEMEQSNDNSNNISKEALNNLSKRCNWSPENQWEKNFYELAINHEITKLITKMN